MSSVEITCDGFPDFAKRIRIDMADREKRVGQAVLKAAWATRAYIADQKIAVAFGVAREHLGVKNLGNGVVEITSTARHAAALETGSGPHMPPVDPIEAWVKLRGAQALEGTSGDWRKAPAARVGASLKAEEDESGSISLDAPRRIAFAIAKAIAIRGTRAQPYLKPSLPELYYQLDHFVGQAMRDP